MTLGLQKGATEDDIKKAYKKVFFIPNTSKNAALE